MTKFINSDTISYDRKIISEIKVDVDYHVFSDYVNIWLGNTNRKISPMFRKNEHCFTLSKVKNMKDLREKLRMNIYGGWGKCNSYLFRKLSEYIYSCIFNSFLMKRIGY